MPHPGQRPIVRKTPLFCLTGSAALLFGSVAVTATTVLYFPFGTAVAAISMIVTAGTLRAFHNFLLHHASHGDFGARSALVGALAGIVALTQPYQAYRRDHLVHHAGLTSDDDPDQQALLALGFRPGLPRAAYPGVLRRALLSPP
ncbi:fatty acid desaturase, partial [Acrocarpospora catenulata]|uniref:fatty acid desaturase n=1 Tax=Acrocarpospora catenulata TaxID=2836182 RepID=UPI001BDB3CE8